MSTNENQLHAAIYACVATPDLATLTALVDQCKDYAEESRLRVQASHIYQEIAGMFTPPRQRTQFAAMLEAAERHEFDLLLVTGFGQISPESGLLEQALAFLRKQEIEVVAVAWEIIELSSEIEV